MWRENDPEVFAAILEKIGSASSVLLTSHESADGDGIGSEVALGLGLRALGKTVRVINNEPCPERFEFLDAATWIESPESREIQRAVDEADLLIVLDNNSWPRLKKLEEPFRSAQVPVVCLDHHLTTSPFSSLHYVDRSATSTGVIVIQILQALGVDLTLPIATAIYVTLCTDSGWFRHSNTTPATFRLAADLLECGVAPERVSSALTYTDSLATKRLLAQVLRTMVLEHEGRVAYASVSCEDTQVFGAGLGEIDGFIDDLRSTRGVLLAVLFKEVHPGAVKVSIRSREPSCAHEIARYHGGGGHRHAAGATLHTTLPIAREKVLADIRRQFAKIDESTR